MTLHEFISVNTHYTRSVNIERDSGSIEVLSSYIPTSRALRTFAKVAATCHSNQAPRAWSLVGPYGSGKSSFSIFLAQLLSAEESAHNKTAHKVLAKADKKAALDFRVQSKSTFGHLQVLVSGAPEPLGPRLAKGLSNAAELFWKEKKGRKPSVLKKLAEMAANKEIIASELLEAISLLQEQLGKSGSAGILLIIDELGKFLEYEARHYGANDIFLLQSLAEHACRGHKANLLVCVLLHQSFEQYAKGLGEALKKEWSKVQGRFEEVPFLESSEQTLRVVSAAINNRFNNKQNLEIKGNVKKVIDKLKGLEALPGQMTSEQAASLFTNCYPFHPITAVLLPILCQKIAQNERTLFSYLGSHEQFGMREIVKNIDTVSKFIMPHDVYDYFITNQSAAIGDHITHRRWVEVVTAIDRLGDADFEEVSLLKTIGLLNIVGARAGFKPSKDLLGTLGLNTAKLNKALRVLKEKSIITFRKFSNEYRVWQGSDFDIELRVQEELANIGNFSIADELNRTEAIMPVVARKYTIESGSFRYYRPFFIDAVTYENFLGVKSEPRILFYLASGKDDEDIFKKKVVDFFSPLDIVVLCKSAEQLREAIAETQALMRIETTSPQLEKDPIAKREFEDRFIAAKRTQGALLQATIDEPQLSDWFNRGIKKALNSKRDLQEFLSEVLRKAYKKAPLIHNELINRDVASSQSNGARNKLLLAMIENEGIENLGIEKNPPEKAIYKSVLLATGIHQKAQNSEWAFSDPRGNNYESGSKSIIKSMAPTWSKIVDFLESSSKSPKSFEEIREVLTSPPYGVKASVLPILYFASYLAYRGELAIFENRRFRPTFDEESIARFIKRPDEFTFQLFRIDGANASIFESYSSLISGNTNRKTILEIAKPFARSMERLSEYTKLTTRGISKDAKAIRSAYNLAKSPQHLLVEGLPKALGFKELKMEANKAQVKSFSVKLSRALNDLIGAQDRLLNKQANLIGKAFDIKFLGDFANLQDAVSKKLNGLEHHTVDTEGVRALLMRLINRDIEAKEWILNVLAYLGQKDVNKWTDSDVDHAENRLIDFSKRINDLERLKFYDMREHTDPMSEIYLIRSTKKGGDIKDGLIAISPSDKDVLDAISQKISSTLEELSTDQLKLSALTKIIDSYLKKIEA